MVSPTGHRTRRGRRRIGSLVALVPVLLLAVDFFLFPDLFESEYRLEVLPIDRLLSEDMIDLGTVHLHRLSVSRGLIGEPEYHRRLGGIANSVVIPAYPGTDNEHIGMSPVGLAVHAGLPPADAASLFTLLRATTDFPPGKVQVLELKRPHPPGPLSAIDYVFMLRAKRGGDRDAKNALEAGLRAAFGQASRRPVVGIIVPCVTVAPGQRQSPSFDDFFRFLFEALHDSASPRNVHISFYRNWTNADLEAAVSAFNGEWNAEIQSQKRGVSRVSRFELRLVLAGLAVCLLVCSLQVRMGLKNFSIVSGAYVLTVLGSFKTVEWIGQGYDVQGHDVKGLGMLVLAVVEAVGFPHFVRWSAKDLFAPGGESRDE